VNALYGVSVFCNGVALVLFFVFAYRRSERVFQGASGLLLFGTVLLGAFLAWSGIHYGGHPAMMPFLSYNFMALLIFCLYFMMEFKFRIPLLGTFLVPIGFFFNILSLFAERLDVTQIRQVSPLVLGIHSGFLLLGEALFLLAFAAALMYLIQEKNLKSKRFNQWYSRLPSLQKLDELMKLGVRAGFPLLTAGLIIGFFWASRAWGHGWFADPKVLWSVVVWVAYALLFYGVTAERIRGRKLARAAILCTVLILVSLVIMRFLTSVHSMKSNYGVR